MRTPSSALPAAPYGLVEGFGRPLPFFLATSFTTFLDFAAAFFAAFLAGFAAFFFALAIAVSLSQSRRVGKGAEGAVPTRIISFQLRSIVLMSSMRVGTARTDVRFLSPS